MVRAPPAYCGGRSVTPKKITVPTAARAGSRVLVMANSVGVIRLRLASDKLKATAVAATATIPVRPDDAGGHLWVRWQRHPLRIHQRCRPGPPP
jgi:hypothetical protein